MYSTIYYIEYFDTENDLVRIDIKKKDFIGAPTLIQGSAVLKYDDRKELTKPIIASTLEIDLEADSNLTLQDLYSEDERTFLVECKKGSDKMLFRGFIKPDGIWEDLVSDSWLISIDCIDGLSTLKDMAFADDIGSPFTGDMCIRDVIYNCLIKTGYDLPINYFINVRLMGAYPQNESFLDKVYMSTIRFYQDAGKSKEMDCESVLKSTLSIFSASVFMHDGEWYIIRMPSYYENMTFRRYVNNTFVSELQKPVWAFLGSQINGHYPHHVNANQRKTILPSVQAYRTRLQYGGNRSKIYNSDLFSDKVTKDIAGWQYNKSDTGISIPDKGGITCVSLGYNNFQTLISNVPNLSQKVKKDSVCTIRAVFENSGNSFNLTMNISTTNYTLIKEFDGFHWRSKSNVTMIIPDENKTTENTTTTIANIVTDPIPEEDYISITVLKPQKLNNNSSYGEGTIKYLGIVDNTNSNLKGEFYVSQRNKLISTVTKEDTTIYNGDTVDNEFDCTLVLKDGSPTPMSWRRLDKPFKDDGSDLEFRPLASFVSEDVLRMNHVPISSLETDILGYIPFISYIHMRDLVEGSYIFTKYSYDTKTCIIKSNIRRFYYRNFLDNNQYRNNQPYEIEKDYGDETKVTVKS